MVDLPKSAQRIKYSCDHQSWAGPSPVSWQVLEGVNWSALILAKRAASPVPMPYGVDPSLRARLADQHRLYLDQHWPGESRRVDLGQERRLEVIVA